MKSFVYKKILFRYTCFGIFVKQKNREIPIILDFIPSILQNVNIV